MKSLGQKMTHTVPADMFEKHTEIKQVFGGLAECLDSLYEGRYSESLNSVLDKLFHKLAFAFESEFVHLANERINKFFHVSDYLVQEGEAVVRVRVGLADCQDHAHDRVYVRNQGLGGVLGEVAGELT